MKLFCTKRSPYARKIRVLALEKGLDLELVDEDLAHKSDELFEANPIGRIPVLISDDGLCLCDSTVIAEYLEEHFPAPAFYPEEVSLKWKVKNLDLIAKGLVDITVSIFYEKMRHPEDCHQKFLQNQEETIQRTLRYFNSRVSSFEGLNMASISIACAIGYLQFRAPELWESSECPELSTWYLKISDRDSMRSTIPES